MRRVVYLPLGLLYCSSLNLLGQTGYMELAIESSAGLLSAHLALLGRVVALEVLRVGALVAAALFPALVV